ncbi:MAG TPA: cobyrinate a,c-diamide synthase, partial [Burkholderiales bacterium]|nr:cobyrinate a,c-diamide synthase [Burkholderiales bacterium]
MITRDFPRLLIAAPHSSAGKTTFTLGLLLALRQAGWCVQPFKVGPDFIDPSHHTALCARASRNLDTWMCENAVVQEIFTRAAAGAQLSVIEGVMGLFDGYGPHEERGSTAHVAKLLQVPVILVIDAQRMATSAAAVALGFEQFDRDVRIAGVVFNRVGSEGHYAWLKNAVEARTGLRSFGYLGFDPGLELEERHLGLVTATEHAPDSGWMRSLKRHFDEHIDLEGLIATARAAQPLNIGTTGIFDARADEPCVRIGVARD